jgi:hypothetical protein
VREIFAHQADPADQRPIAQTFVVPFYAMDTGTVADLQQNDAFHQIVPNVQFA